MTGPRSSLARHAATMRDPDPAAGLAASREAFAAGMVLISLETVEALAGWLHRERLERFVSGFLDEVDDVAAQRRRASG